MTMSLAADKANSNNQLFCYEQTDATVKLKFPVAERLSFLNDAALGFSAL
jgi:hypothetical protein